eukprot:18118-Heterococcus_DN1.PRE.2
MRSTSSNYFVLRFKLLDVAESGLPDDNKPKAGLTSLCNFQTGLAKRATALAIEEPIKRAQRYETLNLDDLASWPAVVEYSSLPKRPQHQVLEHYIWRELRDSSMRHHTMQVDMITNFQQLRNSERNALANQLCDIQTDIEYTLRN